MTVATEAMVTLERNAEFNILFLEFTSSYLTTDEGKICGSLIVSALTSHCGF